MNKNLELAKKIIRAYWREVEEDARFGYSNMGYADTLIALSRIDDDIEIHIKTVAKIMREALKELRKEKNDSNNKKGQDQTNTNRQANERVDECVSGGDS